MEFNLRNTSLLLTILTVGLSAGLLYAWSITIIPGLRKVSNSNYLETMQSINRAILNPWFFIVYFGPIILLILSTYLQFRIKIDLIFWLIFASTLMYILGNVCVTIFGNVPLNEMLDKVNLASQNTMDIESLRSAYENRWNMLNHIRASFSVVSFILVIIAVFQQRAT